MILGLNIKPINFSGKTQVDIRLDSNLGPARVETKLGERTSNWDESGSIIIYLDKFLYQNLCRYGYKIQYLTNIHIHIYIKKKDINTDKQLLHSYLNI